MRDLVPGGGHAAQPGRLLVAADGVGVAAQLGPGAGRSGPAAYSTATARMNTGTPATVPARRAEAVGQAADGRRSAVDGGGAAGHQHHAQSGDERRDPSPGGDQAVHRAQRHPQRPPPPAPPPGRARPCTSRSAVTRPLSASNDPTDRSMPARDDHEGEPDAQDGVDGRLLGDVQQVVGATGSAARRSPAAPPARASTTRA